MPGKPRLEGMGLGGIRICYTKTGEMWKQLVKVKANNTSIYMGNHKEVLGLCKSSYPKLLKKKDQLIPFC